MKFDKRNPFAAWGHEQEIYTLNGDNETIQFTEEMRGFQNMKDLSKDELFVNDNKHEETAGKFTTPQTEVFFTNNENMNETLFSANRMVAGEDIERKIADNYNNAEMNSYGIQAQDLMADTKAHAVEETSEEEDSEEEVQEEEVQEEEVQEEEVLEEKVPEETVE